MQLVFNTVNVAVCAQVCNTVYRRRLGAAPRCLFAVLASYLCGRLSTLNRTFVLATPVVLDAAGRIGLGSSILQHLHLPLLVVAATEPSDSH